MDLSATGGAMDRGAHERWLLEITQIPTASGRERRVVEWIRRWVAERPDVRLSADDSGNLTLSLADEKGERAPVYFTAHLDHPAFVVERMVAPTTLELSFRGGVMDDYFRDARVRLWPRTADVERIDPPIEGTLIGKSPTPGPTSTHWLCELDAAHDDITLGDVATWALPPAEIADGVIRTHACDDLAAAAAALAAFDALRQARASGEPVEDVRVLFTRAEEIGFIGAIAACRNGSIPKNARLLALENSRAFADSPIGGGPIVRVGDRLSVFSPTLTAAVAQRAEQIAGAPAAPTASQKHDTGARWRWQRKLMAGGACEATVFFAHGYDATCLCLPLGNYHNMADLDAVQAGTNTSPPKVGPEYVSIADFHGLVDLLVACGTSLPQAPSTMDRIDKLWNERKGVLEE